MGYICEHELKRGTEYDLYAKLQSTIAWKNDKFVIMKLKHSANPGEIVFESDSLQEVVDEANRLEKAKNTIVKCNTWCAERRHLEEVKQNVRAKTD